MIETFAFEPLSLYLGKIEELSKFVDFMRDSYKVSMGTYTNSKGQPRNDANCIIGPVEFKANYSTRQRLLEYTAIMVLDGKKQIFSIERALNYLISEYVELPADVKEAKNLRFEWMLAKEKLEKVTKIKVAEAVARIEAESKQGRITSAQEVIDLPAVNGVNEHRKLISVRSFIIGVIFGALLISSIFAGFTKIHGLDPITLLERISSNPTLGKAY